MSGNEKKEFGDYQTPLHFCTKVCKYIKDDVLEYSPEAIVEPTCGTGNFISAALTVFDCDKVYGLEINQKYVKEAQKKLPGANIVLGDVFDLTMHQLCTEENVLIIGNPPWATNSELLYNLPEKMNFKKLRGIDALTGSSNFDICEYIILHLIDEYKNTDSTLCMLCKTSVARNVILEISRNEIAHKKIEMLYFDSKKVFGVSVSACILIVQLTSNILLRKNFFVILGWVTQRRIQLSFKTTFGILPADL